MNPSCSSMYRLWDEGQHHLAAGRYVAARTLLDAAERMAWQSRDAASLARIYLSLLETRRLSRYQAVEGRIVICTPATARHSLAKFLKEPGGVILLAHPCPGISMKVRHAARTRHAYLESLELINQGPHTRLVSPFSPTFASGLPVKWMGDAKTAIASSTDTSLTIPLPFPGEYAGTAGGGALARESLLIAWEALALRWQSRHPLPHRAHPWQEIAWLRQALCVDPACEPVAMRLMALAQGIERSKHTH